MIKRMRFWIRTPCVHRADSYQPAVRGDTVGASAAPVGSRAKRMRLNGWFWLLHCVVCGHVVRAYRTAL